MVAPCDYIQLNLSFFFLRNTINKFSQLQSSWIEIIDIEEAPQTNQLMYTSSELVHPVRSISRLPNAYVGSESHNQELLLNCTM